MLASTHIRAATETQAIKFTGGTTGAPKGVMQPLRAWNTNIVTQIVTWGLTAGDAYLACTPITHGASTYILPVLATGGRLILQDRPRPQECLAMLGSGRVTMTFVSPTLIYTMLQAGDAGALDFSRLRAIIYVGAPMRPDAIRAPQCLFGPVIGSTYGQTEAPQVAAAITPAALMRPEKRASVGRETILTQVEIIDSDGRLLPAGEIGEIAIRGDLLMSGYWRQPEKTAEAIVDGWLRTGDLGMFDEDRFLSIKGRNKDLIITGGFNVYPGVIEPVIAAHPAVADCAVFGIPDDKWGEAVHAAVVLNEPGGACEAEIISYVKERLGSVKAPKAIRFVTTLPRNEYGKLRKQELVAQMREPQ